MRGEILDIDSDGAGLVSGNDGHRYAFSAHDVRGFSVQVGQRVDFVEVDGRATDLFLLSAGSAPAETGFHMRADKVETDPGSPWGYFVRCMKKYIDGDGRSPRREYWWFVFFRVLILVGLMFAGLILSLVLGAVAGADSMEEGWFGLFLIPAAAFYVGTILPNFVGLIRRLHDGGFSGWMVLFNLIPYVGGLVVFVLSLQPTQPRRNEYGSPMRYRDA